MDMDMDMDMDGKIHIHGKPVNNCGAQLYYILRPTKYIFGSFIESK